MLRDSLAGSSSRCLAARESILPRCALSRNSHRTIDPHALKIPAPNGAESTLTENVTSPFHAEPRQNPVSNNVGAVKHFLSVVLRALRRARHFALVEAFAFALPTKARS